MIRDWKKISVVAQEKDQVLLSNPDFDVESILEGDVAVVTVGGVTSSVPPTEFSPRTVRRFLWENRKDRSVLRDRSVLKVNREEDKIEMSIAALTHTDAMNRLGAFDG